MRSFPRSLARSGKPPRRRFSLTKPGCRKSWPGSTTTPTATLLSVGNAGSGTTMASRFEVQFFHPGYLFNHPVQIHEVVDGETRPVPFSPKYFRYPDFDPAPLASESQLGFAGFRLLYPLNHAGG